MRRTDPFVPVSAELARPSTHTVQPFDSADDWVERGPSKWRRIALAAVAVAAVGWLAATLLGGHRPTKPILGALPRALDLGASRPQLEAPPPPVLEVPPALAAPDPTESGAPREPSRTGTRDAHARSNPAERAPKPPPRPEPEPEPDTPAEELAALVAPEPTTPGHKAFIISKPKGASVILEGRFVGRTPVWVTWTGNERVEAEVVSPEHDPMTLVLGPKMSDRTFDVVLDESGDEDADARDGEAAEPVARPTVTPPSAAKRAPTPAPPSAPAPPAPSSKEARQKLLDDAFKGL